jgi:hypothetical protein
VTATTPLVAATADAAASLGTVGVSVGHRDVLPALAGVQPPVLHAAGQPAPHWLVLLVTVPAFLLVVAALVVLLDGLADRLAAR